MRTFFKAMLAIAAMLTPSALALGSDVASAAITVAYVSPHGSSTGHDASCQTAAFSSINKAIGAVSAGGTVVVCRGTYDTQAVIRKQLSLAGRPGAVINARGQRPVPGLRAPAGSGVVVLAASNVLVRGLEVVHAGYDAILAVRSARVRVTGDDLLDNGHVGVDFDGTSFSLADHDVAKSNAGGGFLITDGAGRSSFDAIAWNVASGNPGGSGVIVAGDAAAGVTDNLVEHNVLTGDGTSRRHPGAGVLLAAGPARETVSGNGVYANTIYGNGLAGVTVHSRAKGQHMDGNQIISNNIGTNNTVGDKSIPGPPVKSRPDLRTTGILIAAASGIKILISGNGIRRDFYGIFTEGRVRAKVSGNHDHRVTVRREFA